MSTYSGTHLLSLTSRSPYKPHSCIRKISSAEKNAGKHAGGASEAHKMFSYPGSCFSAAIFTTSLIWLNQPYLVSIRLFELASRIYHYFNRLIFICPNLYIYGTKGLQMIDFVHETSILPYCPNHYMQFLEMYIESPRADSVSLFVRVCFKFLLFN